MAEMTKEGHISRDKKEEVNDAKNRHFKSTGKRYGGPTVQRIGRTIGGKARESKFPPRRSFGKGTPHSAARRRIRFSSNTSTLLKRGGSQRRTFTCSGPEKREGFLPSPYPKKILRKAFLIHGVKKVRARGKRLKRKIHTGPGGREGRY